MTSVGLVCSDVRCVVLPQNWTGVLVEAGRWNYRQMLLTHRKSKALNVCLSPTAYPQQVSLAVTEPTGPI